MLAGQPVLVVSRAGLPDGSSVLILVVPVLLHFLLNLALQQRNHGVFVLLHSNLVSPVIVSSSATVASYGR